MLSENFKKIQKNREHLELIWSSYRWDVPTFWTLSALAYFLFHAILKNKKKKLEEIGRKWCHTFETNLGFTLLKKLDISKIAVLKEFALKTGFLRLPKMRQAVVTLLEQIYDLLCSKKCTFEKCTFWRNLRSKLWFNEVSHGRPAVPKLFLYSMSGATLREARASREQILTAQFFVEFIYFIS